ncbi:hypothetical protein ABW19_dt0205412 [Dactylella cylindrospora]|nr:hypothetical protein ABW19_dt0205412 [Dactylella cylindrospora]
MVLFLLLELPSTPKRTGTPKFSPTPATSETDPDREPQNLNNKPIQDDTTPKPEPKSIEATIKKEEPASIPEVVVEPTDVLAPTTKQPNGSEPGSTEEDDDDKSSPLTETSLTSDQMASVAVFPPSADITQKGVRTMEDLEMGNTESDRPSPDRSSAPPSLSRNYMNGQSPESSSLSELESDDSEAETERLNISPQKPPIGNGANSVSYSTPKKSIGESSLTSPSRSLSPLSSPGHESPKSPDREMTLGAIEQLTPVGSAIGSAASSPGRKRKRAESEGLEEEEEEETKMEMEISDLEEEPPKKKNAQDDSKSHTSEDEEDEEHEEHDEEEEDDDEVVGKKQKRPVVPPTNGHVDDVEEDSADDEDESPKPPQRSPGKNKAKPGSAKSSPKKPTASIKITDTDADEDVDEERDTDAADSNQHSKDDEEADEMSRTKRAAAEDLATIEILFAQLRDKIVEERVSEIDKEIAMVQDGTHPELILMSQAIELHKKEKIDKANALRDYQLQTAEIERVANRAAVWSQYSQEIRELREQKFSEANKLWWSIHRERRAADTSVSDYVYKIPPLRTTQINHRTRYNAEVSLLSGIAKNVGFPAAPSIMGATADETRSDLEAMGLAPPPLPAPAPVPVPPPAQTFPTSTPSQAGPSRLPQMSTFGPPTGYSPRPSKATVPTPLANAFQPSPSHAFNPETRRPRTPPSPLPPPLHSVHQSQKPPTGSPRISKAAKGKAAAKPPQGYDGAADPPSKRVPIKLENSPTISSLSFAPGSRDYVAQQTIDRRMQQVGGTGYRPFAK